MARLAEIGDGPTPQSLSEAAQMVEACRRCDLWRNALHGVAGEGPPDARVMKMRGQAIPLDDPSPDETLAMVTVHPSYLLRMPDPAAKAEGFALFVEDLKAAARLAGI
jgi:DNA polymerase